MKKGNRIHHEGFNRNIVECKSNRTNNLYAAVCVLIETLWNVNVASLQAQKLDIAF